VNFDHGDKQINMNMNIWCSWVITVTLCNSIFTIDRRTDRQHAQNESIFIYST